jgi:hypothetical protein
MRRYVQRHTVSQPLFERMGEPRGGMAPWDGIAELWWAPVEPADPATAEAARQAGRELLEDEARFIDLANSPVFFVEDHEVIPFGA